MNNFISKIFIWNKKKFFNFKKFFIIFLLFWIFFWTFYSFQKFSQRQEKISISWKWYDLSQKKYIDPENIKFNNWDLIKRTLFLKNNWFFDVKNFLVKDYNPFTKSNVEFSVDIKSWETVLKSYKVLASKIEKFKEEIKTEKKEIIKKELIPVIWKKKILNPFWSFTWISKDKINNNFDEYFEVYWKWLSSIENILINCWKKSETFKVVSSWDKKVSIQIGKWALWNWICSVWTFFNWITFFSDFSLKSSFSQNSVWVAVKDIVPREVLWKKWWILVFQWSWFEKVVAAQIDNWTILDLNFLKIVNDNVLIVNIPKKFKKWEYFFRLLTKKWVLELKNLKIQVK